MNLGLSHEFDQPLEELERAVIEELKKFGFGILTEIDVRATMRKKLDIDFPPYRILGACNPSRAKEVLDNDSELGLLLPCNVILYDTGSGKTKVSLVNADAMFSLIDKPEIAHIANAVTSDFKAVLNNLKTRFS